MVGSASRSSSWVLIRRALSHVSRRGIEYFLPHGHDATDRPPHEDGPRRPVPARPDPDRRASARSSHQTERVGGRARHEPDAHPGGAEGAPGRWARPVQVAQGSWSSSTHPRKHSRCTACAPCSSRLRLNSAACGDGRPAPHTRAAPRPTRVGVPTRGAGDRPERSMRPGTGRSTRRPLRRSFSRSYGVCGRRFPGARSGCFPGGRTHRSRSTRGSWRRSGRRCRPAAIHMRAHIESGRDTLLERLQRDYSAGLPGG